MSEFTHNSSGENSTPEFRTLGNPYFSKFQVRPDAMLMESGSGFTHITCTHPIHGIVQYWIGPEEFQENIASLLTPFWINNFVIVINCAS